MTVQPLVFMSADISVHFEQLIHFYVRRTRNEDFFSFFSDLTSCNIKIDTVRTC